MSEEILLALSIVSDSKAKKPLIFTVSVSFGMCVCVHVYGCTAVRTLSAVTCPF